MPPRAEAIARRVCILSASLGCSVSGALPVGISDQRTDPLGTALDRGDRDYFGSHDLEDFITVIDGRAEIVAEVGRASLGLRRFVITSIQQLLSDPKFRDALPGYLPPEEEDRIVLLRSKLEGIATLALSEN